MREAVETIPPNMSEPSAQIKPGTPAPDFTLTDQSGNDWSLSDRIGKVVLLLFYPANETLVCTRQLCSLRDNWSKYLDTKAEIVGISSGSREANEAFASKYRLPLQILADEDRTVTSIYAKHWLLPLNFMRGLTVIDARGMVRTHQTMLRAFRPNDHDVILRLYAARAEAIEDRRNELRARVRRMILG